MLSTDDEALAPLKGSFDVMLSTIPDRHDLNPFIQLLKRDGHIVVVGALTPLEPVQNMHLAMKRTSVAGSLIGSIRETQDVLDFCAEHGIAPDVEVIPIQQINEAFGRMDHGDIRFRFVIDMASLKDEARQAA